MPPFDLNVIWYRLVQIDLFQFMLKYRLVFVLFTKGNYCLHICIVFILQAFKLIDVEENPYKCISDLIMLSTPTHLHLFEGTYIQYFNRYSNWFFKKRDNYLTENHHHYPLPKMKKKVSCTKSLPNLKRNSCALVIEVFSGCLFMYLSEKGENVLFHQFNFKPQASNWPLWCSHGIVFCKKF